MAGGEDGVLSRPVVAILPWGDVIEDFLDGIGIDLDGFLHDMSGGWLFGFVESLERAGVGSAIVCTSTSVQRPERRVHRPTGVAVHLLPAGRIQRAARARRGRGGLAGRVARSVGPWVSTPPRLLARALREEGATALLCQEHNEARLSVCVLVGRALGIPAFATFQGGVDPPTAAERLTRRWTLRRSAGLVVGSAAEADRLEGAYAVPAARVHRIPNPLDVDQWTGADRSAARTALGIGEDARVVAWYGRVEVHRKGIDVLLDAWDRLASGGATHRHVLLMVGTGPDAAEVHRRTDGRDDIVWLDEYVLDRAPIHANLAAADLAALPSRHEGFPVALLEMMAAGRAVVSADVPGVREVAPGGEADGCLVVPIGDASGLHRAMAGLLGDDARRAAMERAARRRVEEAFSYDAVGARLAQVLGGAAPA